MGIRFTILLAAVALCLAPGDLLRVEQNDEAMGATFSVVLYGNDRAQIEKAADAAFDEVHRLDRLLSNYKPDSEWSKVNRTAGVRPVKVSAELFQDRDALVTVNDQIAVGLVGHREPRHDQVEASAQRFRRASEL